MAGRGCLGVKEGFLGVCCSSCLRGALSVGFLGVLAVFGGGGGGFSGDGSLRIGDVRKRRD